MRGCPQSLNTTIHTSSRGTYQNLVEFLDSSIVTSVDTVIEVTTPEHMVIRGQEIHGGIHLSKIESGYDSLVVVVPFLQLLCPSCQMRTYESQAGVFSVDEPTSYCSLVAHYSTETTFDIPGMYPTDVRYQLIASKDNSVNALCMTSLISKHRVEQKNIALDVRTHIVVTLTIW
jgi:hypothetical protein